MGNQVSPGHWRTWRGSLGLSLREVSRRSGIPPWRLSIIERGVPATDQEAHVLRATLVAAEPAEGAQS